MVRLHCGNDGIKGITTDGRKLVVSNFDNPEVIQGETEVSIPKSTIDILLSSIQDDFPVDVDIREKSIVFMFQKEEGNLFFQLESTLEKDNFPKWQKIMPATTNQLILNKSELQESLFKMAKFSKDESNMSVWDFNKKRSIAVSVSQGNGNSDLTTKFKVMGGGFDPVVLRVSHKYVLEFLHECSSETVILKQANNQIIFSDPDNQFSCLIMGMKSEEQMEQERKAATNPQPEQSQPAQAA